LEGWVALHAEFEGTEIFSMNEDYLVSGVRLESLLKGVKCSVVNPKGTGVGSGSASVQSPPLVVGQWTHLACVRSAGMLSLFADGQLAGSAPVATDLLEMSPAAMGVPGGYSGKGLRAAPVTIGPTRFSAVARYAKGFSPTTSWPIDTATVAQFLGAKKLVPGAQIPLVDEANGNNLVTSYGGFAPALAELACP
jgi:hypothetical protein